MAVVNSLSGLVPTLFAQGLMSLRSNLVMPGLVANHYGEEARKKGEAIYIPLPSLMAPGNVIPAEYAPDPQDIAPTNAVLPLNNWQEAAFTLTEADQAEIVDGIVPLQLSAAMQALASAVNTSIFALASNVPNVLSDAPASGSATIPTPFATNPVLAAQAGRVLADAYAPLQDRKIVLSPGAYGCAVQLPQFSYVAYAGDKTASRDGRVDHKIGFDWAQDQATPYHDNGAAAGTPSSCTGVTLSVAVPATSIGTAGSFSGAGTAGDVEGQPITITLATGAGGAVLNVGDVLQFGTAVASSAGYTAGLLTATVVTAATIGASTTGTVKVVRGVYTAKGVAQSGNPQNAPAATSGMAVNLVPAHTMNLAFHRSAFAFASRPLVHNGMGTEADELVHHMSDPVSGISLRLILRPEWHRVRASFDILWGATVVRPNLAVRLMGGLGG